MTTLSSLEAAGRADPADGNRFCGRPSKTWIQLGQGTSRRLPLQLILGVRWLTSDQPGWRERSTVSFDSQPVLKGEFVELRPLRAEDYDDLYYVAADPLIWEHSLASAVRWMDWGRG